MAAARHAWMGCYTRRTRGSSTHGGAARMARPTCVRFPPAPERQACLATSGLMFFFNACWITAAGVGVRVG